MLMPSHAVTACVMRSCALWMFIFSATFPVTNDHSILSRIARNDKQDPVTFLPQTPAQYDRIHALLDMWLSFFDLSRTLINKIKPRKKLHVKSRLYRSGA